MVHMRRVVGQKYFRVRLFAGKRVRSYCNRRFSTWSDSPNIASRYYC